MTFPRTPQFGAILFRCGELIGRQGQAVHDDLGISVDARKISIILSLSKFGPMSSSELADVIGISRQLIEQRVKSSVADGFLISHQSPKDSRKRVYDFSEPGRLQADQIINMMVDFEKVYADLWKEIGVELEANLLAFESALEEKSLTQRLCKKFPKYETLEEVSDQ